MVTDTSVVPQQHQENGWMARVYIKAIKQIHPHAIMPHSELFVFVMVFGFLMAIFLSRKFVLSLSFPTLLIPTFKRVT